MKFKNDTKLLKVDLQGVWEERIETLQECYEYVLNTLWIEDKLETEEYDEMLKETDIFKKLAEILIFGDIYEFGFFALDNGKKLEFNSYGKILGECEL